MPFVNGVYSTVTNSGSIVTDIAAALTTLRQGGPTILDASIFAGATAGVQIAAAIAALPAAGGTVDARNLTNRTINGLTISTNNVTILFPPGLFTVTASIVISNGSSTIQNVQIFGNGPTDANLGTTFNWGGSALSNSGLFVLRGASNCRFSDFCVSATSANAIAAGIQSETLTGASTTNNQYYRITMFGQGAGGSSQGMQRGWRFCTGAQAGGSGTDVNNDVNYFDNCRVENIGYSGWSFQHSQSKAHYLHNCIFVRGAIGVDSLGGSPETWSSGGSFRWYGGAGGGVTDTDFAVVENDTTTICNWNSENSNRLVRTGGASAPGNLIVSNNRFATNSLNADNLVVVCNFQGGCLLTGNTFEAGTGTQLPAALTANPAGNRDSGSVALGNTFWWFPATATSQPFQGNWSTMKNFVIDHATSHGYLTGDIIQGPAPITVTSSTYSQTGYEASVIFNGSGSITLTLLTPANVSGLQIKVRTIANQTVVSATSNVVPLAGGAAGTAILAGTAGKWADLQSDGTNWQIMASN